MARETRKSSIDVLEDTKPWPWNEEELDFINTWDPTGVMSFGSSWPSGEEALQRAGVVFDGYEWDNCTRISWTSRRFPIESRSVAHRTWHIGRRYWQRDRKRRQSFPQSPVNEVRIRR